MRALRYFKKELERYADLTSAAGKIANFTPTISPIALSLHTVEELLPYREQFLAAGLAVTSADQGAAKGKMVQSKPEHAPVDGKGTTTYSSPSSSSATMIHFEEPDSSNMALIDELPVRKMKERKRKTRTRSILPWFCRKPAVAPGTPSSAQEGQAQNMLAGRNEDDQEAQAPGLPHKSSMRHVNKHGLRHNRGRSRVRPSPPKQPPPPVPSKDRGNVSRGMDIRLRHRTIITRVPDNVNDAQPGSSRSKSPSHVRNRHLPVTQSAIKKRLSTKLEEAEEILAEDSNTGRAIPMKPTPDLPTRDGTRVPRQESDKPSVKARPRAGKNDLVLAAVEKTPINRPQYVTEHSFAPTPPAMIRKSTELSPVLPITWQYAVGTPSSFEQALDDVVRKLDEMETKPAIHELEVTLKSKRRSPDVKQAQPDVPHLKEAPPAFAEHRRQPGDGESEKSKAMTTDTSSSSFAYHRLQRAAAMRRQRIAAGDGAQSSRPPEDAVSTTASDIGLDTGPPGPSPTNGLPHIGDLSSSNKTTETAKSFSVEEVVVEHHDRDIEDRDVLKGLKLAITAACDENLDAWIRGRTGLRLRRFLADLKTFEALDMEDQVGAQGTAKRPLKDQVDAKDAETDPATTKITAKATNKGRVAEGQPVGSNGKPRSSAGIGRHNPDQNEVKEPENRRTSAGARRPEPESGDHTARKTRADERNTQAEKVTEEEKKHKHLLRVEA